MGAVLATAPGRILVRFSGDIEATAGSIRLYDATGKLVPLGTVVHPDGERAAASAAPLSPLADGGYLVSYQVLSADGHNVRGAFSFQVGTGGAAPSSDLLDRLSNTPPGESALRFIGGIGRFAVFLGTAVGFGLLALCALLWPGGRNDRRVRSIITVALALATLGAVVQLAAAAGGVGGAGLSGITSAVAWRSFTRTGVGLWWVARTVLLAVGCVAAWFALSRSGAARWRLGYGALALALFFTMAKSGHGTTGRWIGFGLALTVVHLAAVSTWVGGLFGLALVALGRPEGRAVATRFSRVALCSAITVVATGLAQAWRQLPTWADLRDGSYGHTLTTKTVLVLTLIGAGWLSRLLVQRPDEATLRLRDVVGMETLLATGILLVTTGLVNLPPIPLRPPQPVNVTLTSSGRLADIILEPAAVGPNTVHLTVTNASGEVAKPDSMLVRLTPPTQDIGPVSSPPSLARANHATFADLVLPHSGEWRLEILVQFGAEQVRFSAPVKIR